MKRERIEGVDGMYQIDTARYHNYNHNLRKLQQVGTGRVKSTRIVEVTNHQSGF